MWIRTNVFERQNGLVLRLWFSTVHLHFNSKWLNVICAMATQTMLCIFYVNSVQTICWRHTLDEVFFSFRVCPLVTVYIVFIFCCFIFVLSVWWCERISPPMRLCCAYNMNFHNVHIRIGHKHNEESHIGIKLKIYLHLPKRWRGR